MEEKNDGSLFVGVNRVLMNWKECIVACKNIDEVFMQSMSIDWVGHWQKHFQIIGEGAGFTIGGGWADEWMGAETIDGLRKG
jgi:hypothetical protein